MKKKNLAQITLLALILNLIIGPLAAYAAPETTPNTIPEDLSTSIKDYNGVILGMHVVKDGSVEGSLAVKSSTTAVDEFSYATAATTDNANIIGYKMLRNNAAGLLLGGDIIGNRNTLVIEGGDFVHVKHADPDDAVQMKSGNRHIIDPEDVAKLTKSFESQMTHYINGYKQFVTSEPTSSLTFEPSKLDPEVLVLHLSGDKVHIGEINIPKLDQYKQIIVYSDAKEVEFSGGAMLYNGAIVNTAWPIELEPIQEEIAKKTTWIFPEAQSVDVKQYGVIGDMYVPKGSINGEGGSVAGSVFAKHLIQDAGFTLVNLHNTVTTVQAPAVEGKVITKYVDEDGKEIAERNLTTGSVGSAYTTYQKELAGYEFVKVKDDNATGKFTKNDITVTYVYKVDPQIDPMPEPIVEGKVITKYVDEDGKEIADRNTSTGIVDTEYTTEKKELPGYKFVEVQDDNATGKFTKDDITVTYVYKVDPQIDPMPEPIVEGKVITKYVDEDGKEIADRNTSTGIVDTDYTTEKKDLPGYKFVKVQDDNQTGKFTKEDITVTYVYKVDPQIDPMPQPIVEGKVITKYVDEDGKEIAKQNIDTGIIDTDYTTEKKDLPGYKFVKVEDDNATGKFTKDDITVTYVYKVDPQIDPMPEPIVEGKVITKYVDEDGKEIADRNTSTGIVDTDYTTEKKDLPGYKFVKVEDDNATGKFTKEDITVTYVYKVDPQIDPMPEPIVEGKVITKYVDEDGKEIAKQNIDTGIIDTDYTTEKKDLPGYKFVKVEDDNATGKFTKDDITVTYVYKVDPQIDPMPEPIVEGKVITKYVDEDGKEIADRNTTTGIVDTEYTTEKKDLPGYKFVKVQDDNQTGKFTKEDITVTYVYKLDPQIDPMPEPIVEGKVITKYVDEDGKEIADRNTSTGIIDTEYTTEKKDLPGYLFVKVQDDNATGKFTKEDITVTYVYKVDPQIDPMPEPIVEGKVITKYVDEDGKEIADRNTSTGIVDTDYTTEKKDLPGYKFVKVEDDNATGKFTKEDITVTYVYKVDPQIDPMPEPIVEGKVITKYVDEDGKEIADRNTTTGIVDTEYTTEKKDLPGYVFLKVQDDNATGKFTKEDITVTYVYKVDPQIDPMPEPIVEGKVITKYVDEDGNEIAKQNIDTGIIDTEYTTEKKDLPGYLFVKVKDDNQTGKFTKEDITVTYVYKLDPQIDPMPEPIVEGKVITKYVDEDGKEIADRNTSTGIVDTEYTTEKKDLPGYEFVKVKDDNATGKFTKEDITVTYVYKLDPQIDPMPEPIVEGKVITKYVDEDGKEIAKQNIDTGIIDTDYTTEKKDLPGYVFLKVQDNNATGKFTKEDITVTYVYKLDPQIDPMPEPIVEGKVITKYVDEDGKEIAKQNIDTGIIDTDYTTEKKDLPGYVFLKVQDNNATGKFTKEDITVTYVYKVDPQIDPMPEPIVEGKVITKYVDEDGKEIAKQNIDTGIIDTDYTTEKKDLPGYVFLKVQDDNATGKFTKEDITVTYVYKVDPQIDPMPEPIVEGKVITKYVDEDGNEIADKNISTGIVDSTYKTEEKDIAGYKFIKVQDDNATGKFTKEDITVVYIYQKDTDEKPNPEAPENQGIDPKPTPEPDLDHKDGKNHPDSNSNSQKETSDDGKKLPKSATDFFNQLSLGIALLLSGLLLFRKTKETI